VHDARRVEEVHALGRLVRDLDLAQRERDVRHQLVVQQLQGGTILLMRTK
jgi:hypothetical protein